MVMTIRGWILEWSDEANHYPPRPARSPPKIVLIMGPTSLG